MKKKATVRLSLCEVCFAGSFLSSFNVCRDKIRSARRECAEQERAPLVFSCPLWSASSCKVNLSC